MKCDNKINIMQLCACQSVYNTNLQNQLRISNGFDCKYNMDAFYIDAELKDEAKKRYNENYFHLNYLKKIICYIAVYKKLRFILRNNNYDNSRDVVNIQYVGKNTLLFLPLLKRYFRKIIASFWGSDLLATNEKILHVMNLLLKKCELITLETNEEKGIFQKIFGNRYDAKLREVRFGINVLGLIDEVTDNDIAEFKSKYSISDKKVIVVGYNRTYAQQHLQVVDSILNNSKIDLEEVQIIIPWTYGEDSSYEYKTSIIKKLDSKVSYCFLEDFLSDKEVAILRKITYIMIQVQTTDSLSSSMLETLYAKGMVITGRWLPYCDLYNMGIKMNTVSDVNETGGEVYNLLIHPWDNKAKEDNRNVIEQYSSWKSNLRNWLDLYE